MNKSVVASARKSGGLYKPLLKYPNGRTEVVEQSPERMRRYTAQGVVQGNRYAVGTTYSSKQEATEAAQRFIDMRLKDAMERYNKGLEMGRKSQYILREIELWGGHIEESRMSKINELKDILGKVSNGNSLDEQKDIPVSFVDGKMYGRIFGNYQGKIYAPDIGGVHRNEGWELVEVPRIFLNTVLAVVPYKDITGITHDLGDLWSFEVPVEKGLHLMSGDLKNWMSHGLNKFGVTDAARGQYIFKAWFKI